MYVRPKLTFVSFFYVFFFEPFPYIDMKIFCNLDIWIPVKAVDAVNPENTKLFTYFAVAVEPQVARFAYDLLDRLKKYWNILKLHTPAIFVEVKADEAHIWVVECEDVFNKSVRQNFLSPIPLD